MVTAVDTNILLDILIPNESYVRSSLRKLENASKGGSLIISEIVYAELASQFETQIQLDQFVRDTHIEIIWSNHESLFMASRLWKQYITDTKMKQYCTECGKSIQLFCAHCQTELKYPRRILNDFIIGAHAKIFAETFLTRDRGFYRKYFEGLSIL